MSKGRISKPLDLSDSLLKDYPGTWTFIQKKIDNINQQRGQCEKYKLGSTGVVWVVVALLSLQYSKSLQVQFVTWFIS